MKLLFVCNYGVHRSVTAAKMFKDKHETQSAGIYENQVTQEQMDWADLIVVMEEGRKSDLVKMFPDVSTRIVNLDIPNRFSVDDPELKKIISEKMKGVL